MGSLVHALPKGSRVDNAYERIRRDILDNVMVPGFQATEMEIAKRMGMSRTPVREALLRLKAEGLLELIPRKGARVLPVTTNDMRDIYEILTTLEPQAAYALALAGLSKRKLRELEDATSDMELAVENNDLDAWAKADDRFHRKFLELRINKRLNTFVMTLYDQSYRARMITMRMRELPTKSTQEHRKILNYILEGDAENARNAFRAHRERSATELLKILENYRLNNL